VKDGHAGETCAQADLLLCHWHSRYASKKKPLRKGRVRESGTGKLRSKLFCIASRWLKKKWMQR